MSPAPLARNERGIALVMTLLLALALSALVIGATAVSMNAGLIRNYSERLGGVDAAALAGLEEARSRLNGTPSLYPADTGYVTLENAVVVRDAAGTIIPGLTRSTWAGPSGVASGQFGVTGSVISMVTDNSNIRVVRRMEVNQESFAKYSYFTDNEGSGICFGGGDNIYGPVHSNDDICLYSSGAWFRDLVRTAGTIVGAGYGTFTVGYQQNVPIIPMPTPAALTKLATQAALGSTSFTGYTSGNTGEARTRVEFVAVDLNADGDSTDADEGFVRVYQAAIGNEDYNIAARYATLDNSGNWNCGDRYSGNHGGAHTSSLQAAYVLVADHTSSRRDDSANHSSLRCFLGGDPALTGGVFTVTTPRPGGGTALGSWVPWTGTVDARVTAAVGATQAGYLHPITRALNPNFKGVVYISGKVIVSGTVRSRVTLAASSDVIIGDNIKQATDPSVGLCDDILGIVAGGSIIVADNMLNAPVQRPNNNWTPHVRPVGNTDEYVQAVLLTMNIFTVQNYNTGQTNRESCSTTNWGRGCLQLTGGIIQQTRGAVGTTAGTGNLKRYAYNTCALTDPPPYFPTTGVFNKSRIYEIDPVGFTAAAWFALYQN
ncbi:MAG: hypothetical protein SGI84_11050 [Gemmatimonadota bacterium]|nr:hypothetical protein [Gemmatimonadota bacterium]